MNSTDRLVAVLLAVSVLGSAGFAAAYAAGADTQVAGGSITVALAALAAAFVVWERQTTLPDATIQEREPLASLEPERDAAAAVLADGMRAIASRRRWLLMMFGSALSALVVAALFPLRSFSPDVDDRLSHTTWRRGLRLVREDGTPVHVDDLAVNSVMTVFPEGFTGNDHERDMAIAATMLVRVPTDELRLPDARATWAVQGCVAYSKVCTHAGCPLGLYRASEHQLYCPCHQSTFDVLRGGDVVFGPAARGVPQLPLAVRPDGYLEAQGDFPEPVGPSYWERG
jgi:ubiquinol-cytochrome c reductase iron-sulfur subunit